MEVIANYTKENKVTCLDFSLTTTPRLPCQASGEGPQSPKSEYLATEDELVIYFTSEQRRSSVLQSTLDDDIWLSVQDNQLDAVVIKHASERVSSG